jgi:hypothetical protein
MRLRNILYFTIDFFNREHWNENCVKDSIRRTCLTAWVSYTFDVLNNVLPRDEIELIEGKWIYND